MEALRGRRLDYQPDALAARSTSNRASSDARVLPPTLAPPSHSSLPPSSSMPSLSSGHSYYTVESLLGANALPSPQFTLPPPRLEPYTTPLQADRAAAVDHLDSQHRALVDAAAREGTDPRRLTLAAADTASLERAALERALVERAAAERAALEWALTERDAVERALAERAASERALAERAIVEQAAAERAIVERALVERAAAERALLERAAAERPAADRAVLEQMAGLHPRAAIERAVLKRAARERASLGHLDLRSRVVPDDRAMGLRGLPADRAPGVDRLHIAGQDPLLRSQAPPSRMVIEPQGLPAPAMDPRAPMRRDPPRTGTNGLAAQPVQRPVVRKPSQKDEHSARATGEQTKIEKDEAQICSLCKVHCANSKVMQTHVAGKKHKKQVELAKAEAVEKKKSTAAEKKAAAEVQKAENDRKVEANLTGKKRSKPDKVETSAGAKRVKTSEQAVNTPVAKVTENNANETSTGSFVHCEVCNIMCTSQKNLETHYTGKKHIANVKQAASKT